ncbi:hypothetical protein BDP55DRAFT_389201 [Colletotrichum godetiae]|uniref:Uncharacterized protein n=1 Tax=Colletotrichum godetiae TaxID=1209918 RepID=A0AAJ0A8U5_9PEZI|nr:uncharacterized protein BDP55DRAFT_389201 [Colletotrichum godetiae]KAK1658656.1 hypothetical protein BDP55DRAFT_389201 [Colletotrichum godetiae]
MPNIPTAIVSRDIAQAISEFGAAIQSRKDDAHIRFKNLQTRSPSNATEVLRLTEEINSDGARHHGAWKLYATRLVNVWDRIRTGQLLALFRRGFSPATKDWCFDLTATRLCTSLHDVAEDSKVHWRIYMYNRFRSHLSEDHRRCSKIICFPVRKCLSLLRSTQFSNLWKTNCYHGVSSKTASQFSLQEAVFKVTHLP